MHRHLAIRVLGTSRRRALRCVLCGRRELQARHCSGEQPQLGATIDLNVFEVAKYEYRDDNAVRGTWGPVWPESTSSLKVSREINNIFRQDSLLYGIRGYDVILSTLGTRYLAESCRDDIRVQQSPEYQVSSNCVFISHKTPEDYVIPSTLGTRVVSKVNYPYRVLERSYQRDKYVIKATAEADLKPRAAVASLKT
ncbi:hypothetical protein TSAR_005887 [Trichomalopsis sarcophagae]|uniref:Uncharacterized protein n=1 Tax=Trichomalopsis sarcophagae TaxID=543379 RepID=A0A232EUR1_9HYME|nr:hypothetical protein TSAR_005887 [Trichomalopsis sarcophagae]